MNLRLRLTKALFSALPMAVSPLYDDTFERLAAVTPAGTTPLAARGSHGWLKKPEDVVPLALFMACQHDVGPTAQSFSLMRRF
jgi:3-oxoacyl-[acyl-carrier protein] reductase